MLRQLRSRREHPAEPNEYRILRLAREARRISRIEIAHRTRLSKATVSEITGRLVDAGILVPVGNGPAGRRGGRKREMLEFNPGSARVIGVDIERTHADVAVTDLGATILRRTSFSYPAGASPERVLKELVRAIRSLGSRREQFHRKAVGIGIGLPGVIDQESGTIRVADTLRGWEGVAIAGILEKEFNLPVFAENDVKARTLGELIFGTGRNVRDAVYLWLGDGIGAGLVVGGHLHHGFTFSAGEIGYNPVADPLPVREKYPLLFDGQKDIGELLSGANIARALGHGRNRLPARGRLLPSGDERGNRVLAEIGDVIGSLCITIVNMLNPEVITLGGELFWSSERLVQAVQQKMKSAVLPVPANAVRIAVSDLKEDGVLLGSVGHVLFDLFRPTRESQGGLPQPAPVSRGAVAARGATAGVTPRVGRAGTRSGA